MTSSFCVLLFCFFFFSTIHCSRNYDRHNHDDIDLSYGDHSYQEYEKQIIDTPESNSPKETKKLKDVDQVISEEIKIKQNEDEGVNKMNLNLDFLHSLHTKNAQYIIFSVTIISIIIIQFVLYFRQNKKQENENPTDEKENKTEKIENNKEKNEYKMEEIENNTEKNENLKAKGEIKLQKEEINDESIPIQNEPNEIGSDETQINNYYNNNQFALQTQMEDINSPENNLRRLKRALLIVTTDFDRKELAGEVTVEECKEMLQVCYT